MKKALSKKILKSLLFTGASLVGLSLLLWVGTSIAASKQSAKMDAKATAFFQQDPKAETTRKNDAALDFEKLINQLGFVAFASPDSEGAPTPDEAKAEAFSAISEELLDYLKAQTRKTQGPLDPIPENLKAYLKENESAIAAIETSLRSSEVPLWNFDVEQSAYLAYRVPYFLSGVNLQRVLSLKSIHHSQQRQTADMVASLEASQAMMEMMAQRPELISYLVKLIMTSLPAGTIRHLDNVPTSITNNLAAHDYQAEATDYLTFDNWMLYKAAQKYSGDPANAISELSQPPKAFSIVLKTPLAKPYFSLSAADFARKMDMAYQELPALNICAGSLEEIEAQLEVSPSWWNIWEQAIDGSYIRQWQKSGRRMLDVELTQHVVQAKALAAEQGQWPETLPDLASKTCPGENWVYEVSADGEMSLSFSNSLDWIEVSDDIPLAYQAKL